MRWKVCDLHAFRSTEMQVFKWRRISFWRGLRHWNLAALLMILSENIKYKFFTKIFKISLQWSCKYPLVITRIFRMRTVVTIGQMMSSRPWSRWPFCCYAIQELFVSLQLPKLGENKICETIILPLIKSYWALSSISVDLETNVSQTKYVFINRVDREFCNTYSPLKF
jgi:hypothetical protein